MLIHNFHRDTGEYLSTTTARIDPVGKTPLIPACACPADELPIVGTGEAIVRENGAWVVKEDHRGADHWGADGVYLGPVDFIGALPAGATLSEPAPTEGELANAIRAKRDKLLAESDWTQLPDSPLVEADKVAWATYRQALREVPQQAGFPYAVTWPAQPAG